MAPTLNTIELTKAETHALQESIGMPSATAPVIVCAVVGEGELVVRDEGKEIGIDERLSQLKHQLLVGLLEEQEIANQRGPVQVIEYLESLNPDEVADVRAKLELLSTKKNEGRIDHSTDVNRIQFEGVKNLIITELSGYPKVVRNEVVKHALKLQKISGIEDSSTSIEDYVYELIQSKVSDTKSKYERAEAYLTAHNQPYERLMLMDTIDDIVSLYSSNPDLAVFRLLLVQHAARDLNGLKFVNDYAAGGHKAGNEYLKVFGEAEMNGEISEILRLFGIDYTLIWQSGDEFGVVLDSIESGINMMRLMEILDAAKVLELASRTGISELIDMASEHVQRFMRAWEIDRKSPGKFILSASVGWENMFNAVLATEIGVDAGYDAVIKDIVDYTFKSSDLKSRANKEASLEAEKDINGFQYAARNLRGALERMIELVEQVEMYKAKVETLEDENAELRKRIALFGGQYLMRSTMSLSPLSMSGFSVNLRR